MKEPDGAHGVGVNEARTTIASGYKVHFFAGEA
jgi:hypothetical protein